MHAYVVDTLYIYLFAGLVSRGLARVAPYAPLRRTHTKDARAPFLMFKGAVHPPCPAAAVHVAADKVLLM